MTTPAPAPGPAPEPGAVHGFDLGHRDTVAAEHWLISLLAGSPPVPGPAGPVACTHLVHGDRPRVVVTVAGVAGLPATGDSGAARAAAADHAAGRAGRAFRYPGLDGLTGTLTVADLLARSAIDAVTVIGGPPAGPDAAVDTRDFVRPQWQDGKLVLVATPAPGGRIAPFEVPNPTPCCAAH
jgi:hypothetical protein